MISNTLPTDYQTFIATSRYARWLEEEGRRETWAETVTRFMDNIVRPHLDDDKMYTKIEESILTLCLLYTSPSPRDGLLSRMPSSA